MTITVRTVRRGTVIRLTGAHARAATGFLLNLIDSAEPAADASNRVPERSKPEAEAQGAAPAPEGSQRPGA